MALRRRKESRASGPGPMLVRYAVQAKTWVGLNCQLGYHQSLLKAPNETALAEMHRRGRTDGLALSTQGEHTNDAR
jgi:hypothetical protein